MSGHSSGTVLAGCTGWPDETAETYRASGYWRGESLTSLLRSWARAYGERTSLVHGERRISYAELDALVDRSAAGFRAHGITPGDRVVLQLPNVPEFVVVYFALLRAGARPVFALAAHRANEIRHLCQVSGAVGHVIPKRHLGFDFEAMAEQVQTDTPGLRSVFVLTSDEEVADGFVPLSEVDAGPVDLPEPDASDVAFFLLSGGTTAMPKLIPRTHDDYAYQIRASARVCRLSAEDVYLAVLPIEFNFPWGCPGVLGTLDVGGTVVLAGEAVAEDCFALVEREGVTFTSLVPTLARLWVDEARWTRRDLSSLRLVQVGGARLTPQLAARVQPALGCRLQQVFGMAEGLLCFTRDTDDYDTVVTTQGSPMSPGDEIRVVDDADQEVPAGRPGHLLVRGPYTLRGYFRAPEHNAHAFTDDGYYRTGDIVRHTAEGNLVVEGRAKDVIIRGGDKISAAEIEELLLDHLDVVQAAVVGLPDELLGERTCAVLVATAGNRPDLPQVKRALHARGVAEYKLPDRVAYVDALPLTPLGKVDKKALAARVAVTASSGKGLCT
ncbi:(2,3-dihydroxybenzoyl)adenylate synthase [Streptomyces olivaceus]|uniref:(2,3-dihydroxybenzoyl)adenylate synthase n=1 Tax=Streptomyces olivaceus TaxID=47716 RepID=UPI0040566971